MAFLSVTTGNKEKAWVSSIQIKDSRPQRGFFKADTVLSQEAPQHSTEKGGPCSASLQSPWGST